MSLNFGAMSRAMDTSQFLTKTNAKMNLDLNMNGFKIINLRRPSPDGKEDASNKAYVDKLIDHIGVHIIDPMYETAIYSNYNEMATTGPYGTRTEIMPTHPDVVRRFEEIRLTLKWDRAANHLAVDGQQIFVFAGFNKITGKITAGHIKIEQPTPRLDYIGVFATDRDTDIGKYIVYPIAEDIVARTYKLVPNTTEFVDTKYIGVELVGTFPNTNTVWVKLELVLDARVEQRKVNKCL